MCHVNPNALLHHRRIACFSSEETAGLAHAGGQELQPQEEVVARIQLNSASVPYPHRCSPCPCLLPVLSLPLSLCRQLHPVQSSPAHPNSQPEGQPALASYIQLSLALLSLSLQVALQVSLDQLSLGLTHPYLSQLSHAPHPASTHAAAPTSFLIPDYASH